MGDRSFRLDVSGGSTVALCACGWRIITRERPGALTAAAVHERVAHPGRYHARNALAKWEARHAPR